MRSSSKECSRRYQRFSVSPEPFFARSSKLMELLPVASSENLPRETFSNQLETKTANSISIRELKPNLPHREPLMKLLRRPPRRRRSEQNIHFTSD
jgi:hypothetical protein